MIVGFSGFGFPKAHGAAFGLLAYQSTWLRVHYGPEFLCALLNEQPMGFYPPDALVHEAQRRGHRDPAARHQRERGRVHGRARGRGADRPGVRARSAGRRGRGARRRPRRAAGRSARWATSRRGRGRGAPWRSSVLAWSGRVRRARRRRGPAGASGALLAAAPRALAPGGACLPAGGEGRSSRCRSTSRRLRRSRPWSAWAAMIADYATIGLTVHAPPAEPAAARLPADAVTSADLERLPHGSPREHRRHRRRPPAAGDRQGHRVPPDRGRARDGQPHRPAADLRAPPAHGAHRAARARRRHPRAPCPPRAGRSTSSSIACGPIDAPDRARLAEVKDFSPLDERERRRDPRGTAPGGGRGRRGGARRRGTGPRRGGRRDLWWATGRRARRGARGGGLCRRGRSDERRYGPSDERWSGRCDGRPCGRPRDRRGRARTAGGPPRGGGRRLGLASGVVGSETNAATGGGANAADLSGANPARGRPVLPTTPASVHGRMGCVGGRPVRSGRARLRRVRGLSGGCAARHELRAGAAPVMRGPVGGRRRLARVTSDAVAVGPPVCSRP